MIEVSQHCTVGPTHICVGIGSWNASVMGISAILCGLCLLLRSGDGLGILVEIAHADDSVVKGASRRRLILVSIARAYNAKATVVLRTVVSSTRFVRID